MFDVALSAAGAQISFATSCDENYPPEHIIDGKDDTFWTSTGLFPQEFIVTFASLMNINTVKIDCSNVRKLLIERSVQNDPNDFEVIETKEMENSDGQWQAEEITMSNTTAVHLKFSVLSAYDHFVAVHRLHVDGNAVHG